LLFLVSCLFVSRDIAVAQNKHQGKYKPIHFSKNLPILSIDACIENLLASVAKSNAKYFKNGQSFYSLEFFNRKGYRYLGIYLDKLNDVKNDNYVAVIKTTGVIFLCRGNVLDNPLFHNNGMHKEHIEFTMVKSNPDIPLSIEPSLQSTFDSCSGLPIYIEVYTPERSLY